MERSSGSINQWAILVVDEVVTLPPRCQARDSGRGAVAYTARLRLAAVEQPGGDLKRPLTWAEMHIDDRYERILSLGMS